MHARHLKAVLVALTLLLAPITGTVACDNEPLYKLALKDGRVFGILASAEAIARTPAWPENSDTPPPMTWMAATDHLTTWARQRYAGFEEVKYYQVDVRRPICAELSDHVFYVYFLSMQKGSHRYRNPEDFAVVLLDGTVLGPKQLAAP